MHTKNIHFKLSNLLQGLVFFIFLCFNQGIAFGQTNSYENEMGGIESLQKTICLNGLWNTACSSNSSDILFCAKKYSGDQAQRICQYELGLSRRQLEWVTKENRKQATLEAEQERQRKIATTEAEAKRRLTAVQAREDAAQNCLKIELPTVLFILKRARDQIKSKYGKNFEDVINSGVGDWTYRSERIPVAKSIPEFLHPILSQPYWQTMLHTDCDSETVYYGFAVSLDKEKIDGFLAFKNTPERPDDIDSWSEINELQWHGQKLKAEIKRAKTEEDRKNLELIQREAEKQAAAVAKAKMQSENFDNFLKVAFLLIFIFGIFSAYYYRYINNEKRKNTSGGSLNSSTDESNFSMSRSNEKQSVINDHQYNFSPATSDQVAMQDAFRAKNPFVAHNVRFEHMARFIESCNQHQAEKGSFPGRDEQQAILTKITMTRNL